ncbi:amidohydrolase family protein [Nonomuraea sp. K274]|uniref:Amidohydrolase family protein n=1 Tax=Nonomuraea cypriaca TaxID=1187855 RepID=A0A931AFF1_9ACTN|nr:amidohydrolase family protein [Nonomuraea cypriaca]MBF8191952.1 amidohydrolase family protein [Nonomuraea cypriaca]
MTGSRRTAIVGIGDSHAGDLAGSPIGGDAIICEDGLISWIGQAGQADLDGCATVLDVGGAAVVPGLIDSHVHVTFGDYTPRQRTVGFLESYLHGGMTRAISASEVHVPGRPTDVVGVKALAIAAQRCFADYRPGGVTVHAGSVILEPGLTADDFAELYAAGVRLAKGGFGAFAGPHAYTPVVRAAREAGLVVMVHTGGGSIRGSLELIDAQALLEMRPNVLGHVNGGPTALSPAENVELVTHGHDMALQLVQAGNLRSAIHISELALVNGAAHRLLIASDTPTGTGVIPLALLRTMAELVSLGPLDPAQAVAAATGNVADTYRLDAGRIAAGRPADLVVLDAPLGSRAADWRGALKLGDLPAVAAVVTQGEVRFTKSRNTPPPRRAVRLTAGTPQPLP